MCRDSAPSAISPLFSHQDPAGTCSYLSKGQGQGGRGEHGETMREAHSNTYFWIYRARSKGSAQTFPGVILSRLRQRISPNGYQILLCAWQLFCWPSTARDLVERQNVYSPKNQFNLYFAHMIRMEIKTAFYFPKFKA